MRFLFILFFLVSSSTVFAETRTIDVSGIAEKSVDPNMISLNVEIWSKASTAMQAQQLVANEYQKVNKVFENFKLKKEEINTQSYNLNPEYTYDQKTQQNKMTGFRANQVLSVVLHKIDEAGNFLDAISSSASAKNADSGVSINNIQWDSDKRSQVEISGLGDAVQDARRKADEIAKAAGVQVRGVLHMSHAVSRSNPPMPVHSFALRKEMAADAASTEMAAGQIKVRVEVQAEYEIN